MAAKIFRINYKSDFILTLNSDAGWMTPFCIKFWTGAPSQAFFVGWDGETYTHCAYDPSEPTKLLVQFDDHHLPIGDLKFQIAYHFTVADFPNDTEDEVINPANITTEIDGETYQVMLDFTGETAPEIEFSLPAYANEAQRIANEQQRIAAEQQRIANENARIAAEIIRQQNEQQRIDQETARVNEFATLKSQSQAATRDANDAATLANQKAQLAADKAALADDAATLANQKAQLAADKAALANDAAQLANEKAALAQQKAEYAQQQGGYAKDQGDYAKDQGDYAKEQGDTALADHQRAESDHGIAVDDHTQAGNDHTRAESDHGIAVDDHTQAGNDHTRAESDHGIASDDHTQAGNDHTRAESDHTRAESDHAAVEVYVDSLGAFDISAYHATGGVLAEYADLTAALGTNGANIPDALRKGGMSVKFVSSSDNKYVQYRYMGTATTGTPNPFLNTANWQGVISEVKENSKDLVESGAVALATNRCVYTDNALLNKAIKFLYWDSIPSNKSGWTLDLIGYYSGNNTFYAQLRYNDSTLYTYSHNWESFDGHAKLGNLHLFIDKSVFSNQIIEATLNNVCFLPIKVSTTLLDDFCITRNKIERASVSADKLSDDLTIFKDISNITSQGTVTSDYYMGTNGTTNGPYSAWQYITFDVINLNLVGKTLKISAKAGQIARLWVLFDSNDNVIGYHQDSSVAHVQTDYLSIPLNAAKVVVNNKVQEYTASVYEEEALIKAESVYVNQQKNIKQYVDEKIVGTGNIADGAVTNDKIASFTIGNEKLKSQLGIFGEDIISQATKHDNYFWSHNTNAPDGLFTTWSWYEIAVNVGEIYKISSTAGQGARLWTLLDANGNRVAESEDESSVGIKTEEMVVVQNAVKLIINSRMAFSFDVIPTLQIEIDAKIDANQVYIDEITPIKQYINETSVSQPSNLLYGKTLVCCGDSITYGADMNQEGITQDSPINVFQSNGSGDFSQVTSNFLKSYGYQIAERNNMIFYNAGVSGSTMQGLLNKNGFSLENGRYTKLPDNIDYLTIWFGWNDDAYGIVGTIDDMTNESYFGGYNVVLPYLINKYPYAKICLCVPFLNESSKAIQIRQAVRDLANKWGVACWDNYQGGTPLYYGKEASVGVEPAIVTANRAKFQAKGAHPNYKGHRQIGNMLEQFLRGI